jgi:hypothetical protein
MTFTLTDPELGRFAAAVVYVRWLLRWLAGFAAGGYLLALLLFVGAGLGWVLAAMAVDAIAAVGCWWALRGWTRTGPRSGSDG